ncbi:aminoglycoside phosphotransferase (APT) family kinase protein [Methanococcus maripaludis]|uniref:Aminoglycoside phosphotransferase (APT) family kinase protein n=1 Tax=Methanococcus maripaludis TaxID=39152 RepID=A0A2L1CAC5_METMI|nr:phosphotransferase [Methanococcus maripaludis]AVB76304.1 Phosphotransferase enzyme family protein [Methanococcus maripaludis]MBB6401936.1 aminoglycoside phosphotransferase (APT) family kinase protein [Methanococcus maripaludis]
MFKGINGNESWDIIEEVNKGWSEDKKYHIITKNKENLLLRISDIKFYERKQKEYDILLELSKLDFEMSKPVDFGICESGVYMLLTWVEGEDLETAILKKNTMEQYNLGIKSGKILKKIHSLNISSNLDSWEKRFNKKIGMKIKAYLECPLKYENGEVFIEYINRNRHLLKDIRSTLQHGDYHVGNMILTNNDDIAIIDFNRYDFGDPYEEFNRIIWDVEVSKPFAVGKLDGYFNGNIPEKFFQLLALYISVNTISSLPWAIPFGEEQINIMTEQAAKALIDYDYFNTAIPKWYTDSKCMIIKEFQDKK